MPKILIVDDDELLASIVEQALTKADYLVDIAPTGLDAQAFLRVAQYDLIILDWELPDATGIEICRQIRASTHAHVPILFFTARGGILDKEQGFNVGADDYLTKPFHIIELMARVKALLRRPHLVQSRQIKMRNITLDMDKHEVFVEGDRVELFPKEYSMLEFFMTNPNQIFTSEDLMRSIWSTDSESSPETVRVTLMRVRHKLKLSKENPLIVTLRHVGYRLEP